MTVTPWGDAAELRARQLNPGSRTPAEEVVRNQRERLFGALVASAQEKGYGKVAVADLLEISGVSRATFYSHFTDKDDCFMAALDAMVGTGLKLLATAEKTRFTREQARMVFDGLIDLMVSQAAAARMCLVDIYVAGPKAVGALERSFDAFERFAALTLAAAPEQEEMPRELVRGTMGGLQKVIHSRLYRGDQHELPELADQLWDWGISYQPPPTPLRRRRRRRVTVREYEGEEPAERLLRALAAVVVEEGYPQTTVARIVERASTSPRTFYEHFEGREEAMLAALDRGASQMLAAILPEFRRATDWPQAVRFSFDAMFGFAARDPAYALLGVVGAFAAGRRALEARDNIMAGLEGLLLPGYELEPKAPAVAAEAIGGAIYMLIYDQLKRGGAESLTVLTPMATYIALSPFIGPEAACEVANEEGRR